MARAKLSYAPPQPNIWVRRRGWTFDYFVEEPRDSDAARDRDADKVAEFLVEELYHGRRYTARSLEDSGKLKLPRARLRAALAALEAAGRLEERELPTDQRRGRKKHYLHCAKASGAMAAETPPEQPTPPPIAPDISIAPPYRETRNGAIDAVSVSPASLHCAKPNGAIAAQWRNSDEPATQPAEQAPDIARDNPQPPAASPKCPAKPPVFDILPGLNGGACRAPGQLLAFRYPALRPTQPIDFSERIVFPARRQFELPPRLGSHAQFGQHHPHGIQAHGRKVGRVAAILNNQLCQQADEQAVGFGGHAVRHGLYQFAKHRLGIAI